MSDRRWDHVKEIVADVLECEPAERAAFIDRVCDDTTVRKRVEALIEIETDARSFLETPVPVAQKLGAGEAESPIAGRRIGAFRITRLIGTGGMGAVYEATQAHPRRTVALKVMIGGLFTPGEPRRFEREVQVLGRLRHPGIAQIYEAGIHEDGPGAAVPYFAMELVVGAKPILDYAAEAAPDRRQRLELFLQVCDAVSHGHQRGVIHRDLKPGNILVDPSDHPLLPSPTRRQFGGSEDSDATGALPPVAVLARWSLPVRAVVGRPPPSGVGTGPPLYLLQQVFRI